MTSVVDRVLQVLAEHTESDASAPQAEKVDRKLRGLEDAMIGMSAGEEDDDLFEAEAGDVSGVSCSKRPSAIAIAVVTAYMLPRSMLSDCSCCRDAGAL
ncbi:hypothetical protein ERJ75_000857100 [Trypanosoma vivax]|nr:hypothetical protein ERJ75_000857100 [Trypanosoma vivax]